jgi:hypothetical protein
VSLITIKKRPPRPPRPNMKGRDYASVNRRLSEEATFWYGVMIEHEKERGAIGLPPANPEDPDCIQAHREGFEARHGDEGEKPAPRADDGLIKPHHSKTQPRKGGRFVKEERKSTLKLRDALKQAKAHRDEERELLD